ncbi:MAG: GTPase HflX [Balneolales bacterium]|nr:GTPase HflX [Balneolales bacterium]
MSNSTTPSKSTIQPPEKAVLVGLYGHDTPQLKANEYINELEMLVNTAGGVVVEKVLQNRDTPDSGTYIGKGKLAELNEIVGNLNAEMIVFDDDLSPTQVRNIEKATKAKILDRSGLILDIFASRAQTAAAKTQVELAQLQYLLPRLTRYWTHLSRQKGGIGTKGPGETQIETDRRLIGKRISVLKTKLEKLDKQRKTQRKKRSSTVRMALVGYTNVGKSSLLNALTETDVLAENKLFATLDSTVRRFSTQNVSVLLSDTVGFIRKLPHHLVDSFKSTLDEIREADVLMHVMDASSDSVQEYKQVVDDTLKGIDSDNKPVLLIFNKVDAVEDPEKLATLRNAYPDAIFISAHRGLGLDKLESKIETFAMAGYIKAQMKISLSNFKAISFVFDNAEVQQKKYHDSYIDVHFLIRKDHLARLESLLEPEHLIAESVLEQL